MNSETEFECPGCDGDGSRSNQLAKQRWVRLGGDYKSKSCGRDGWVYFEPGGTQEIEFKEIEGPCTVCLGQKVLELVVCALCERRAKMLFFRDPGPCPVCLSPYRRPGHILRPKR